MLVQSSLPDSISTVMPFPNHAKEEKMDPSYDWSHFAKTWHKSSKCDECCQERCRNCTASGSEEKKFSCKVVDMSTCSDISSTVCASSVPKRDGYVYKRRKLQQNDVALLSEDSTFECSKESAGCDSSISSEDHNLSLQEPHDRTITRDFHYTLDAGPLPLYDQDHPQDRSTSSSFQMDDARVDIMINNAEDKLSLRLVRSLEVHASEHKSVENDRCMTTRDNIGQPSDELKNGVEDSSECSSSGIAFSKPLEEFTSEKELCIFVLKSYGLLGCASDSRECASLEVLGSSGNSKSFKPCKLCGMLEDPLKMFICDLCEEAFHVSCCDPRFRNLQVDEWYCQPCSRSRPAIKCNVVGDNSYQKKRTSYGDLGPILFMLRDDQPYTSGARIGKGFQAEVPEWSGPVSSDSAYFSEPPKLDPAHSASMDCWNYSKPIKVTSIGNWVQCQELIFTSDDDDEGTICGKWRRAPLFVVQSDDWDCSCALLWDPIHADCAVPQELETEVVLKHLKYIEMLRPRLADNKQKLKVVASNDLETTKGDN